MKQLIRLSALSLVLSGSVFISACGSDTPADPVASLVARFTDAVSLLGTSAGLKDAKVASLFDDAYKEGGYVKSALSADLQAESASLAANADASLFPIASLKDVTVTGCDANNICTLTGKLVNSDADVTETTITTKVKSVNGEYYFYGDQQAT
jgi:hypothetical protein